MFPAISTIVADLSGRLYYQHCARIWIEDAPRGLAWTTDGMGSVTAEWRAPSWSWASQRWGHNTDWVYDKDDSSCGVINHTAHPDMFDTPVALSPLLVEAQILSLGQWTLGKTIVNGVSYLEDMHLPRVSRRLMMELRNLVNNIAIGSSE
jgi:hypothetical protein